MAYWWLITVSSHFKKEFGGKAKEKVERMILGDERA